MSYRLKKFCSVFFFCHWFICILPIDRLLFKCGSNAVRCFIFFLLCLCSFELISIRLFCFSLSFVFRFVCFFNRNVWCFQFCWKKKNNRVHRGRFNVSISIYWQLSNWLDETLKSMFAKWVRSMCLWLWLCLCLCLCILYIVADYNFLRKCSVRLIMLLSL